MLQLYKENIASLENISSAGSRFFLFWRLTLTGQLNKDGFKKPNIKDNLKGKVSLSKYFLSLPPKWIILKLGQN